MNLNRKKGIAQLMVVAVMAFLALGVPLTTKLVQENQENRSQAATVCRCSNPKYFTAVSCSKNGGKWNCGIGPTRVPTKKPIPTRVPTKKVTPTPSRIPTKAPICVTGKRKCSGFSLLECRNNVWVKTESCLYGCDLTTNKCKLPSPTPRPSCTNGSRKCEVSSSSLQECRNGVWLKIASCVEGCDVTGTKCRLLTSTPTPIMVYGKCGNTRNSCVSGLFVDVIDNSSYYLWRCMGKNGGTSVSCKTLR